MYAKKAILCVFVIIVLCFMNLSVMAQVNVDPFGLSAGIVDEDTVATDMTITNNSDVDLSYKISTAKPPERDGGAPRQARRDEPEDLNILLIKAANDPAYGWHNRDSWLAVFDDHEGVVELADIEDLEDYELDDYDLLATGEDQDGSFYQQYTNHREMIEEYIDRGGLFSFFTGSNSFQDITMPGNVDIRDGPNGDWGDVNPEFINEDGDGLIDGIEEDLPILTPFEFFDDENVEDRQRIVMRGNSLNYSITAIEDLPEEAVWYYRPGRDQAQEDQCIIADWPFGSGYVLFTGITGTLFYELDWQWSSMMECVNLTRWADGRMGGRWLQFIPKEGMIPEEEAAEIEVLLIPGEMEDGLYERRILIELSEYVQERRDDFEPMVIEMSVVMSLGTPAFEFTGTVTDASDNLPVEGVRVVLDQYIITRYSDGEGNYSFADLPPGTYNVTFTATDYLPTTEEITIEEEDVQLNIALLHSEFTPDPEEGFEFALEPDLTQELDLTVENTGNGPLTYMVERHLIGDADLDPWTMRLEVEAEEIAEDGQLNGIAVVDGLMYVSGGNNGEDLNLIHVFDQEGALVNQFEQFAESRYGMRDLTWDTNLIWGADGTTLYGFNTEGDLVETIEGQARSYRCLAWDKDRNVFWSADVTSDLYATDPENGEVVATIDVDAEERIYGLSYWADDPDGYCLYIFTRGDREEVDIQVNKMDVETGEMVMVMEFEDVSGRPGGIDLTNQFDVYSYVLMGIVQGPDRIMTWQLEGRRDWFLIDPTAGQIAAGDIQEFVVTLDATGLPIDNTFVGEFVFIHDGVGGETIVPVTLMVVEGEVWTTRDLDLNLGWNTVSVNVQAEANDIELICTPLVEAGLLEIMKDDEGHFYLPEFGHNNMGGWLVQEGYMMKMSGAADLEIEGMSVLNDRPIALHEGWQLISYYPNFGVEATLALSDIVGNLVICKDGQGNFYLPEWDYSNIGDMERGQGYFVKMIADDELVYTTVEGERVAADGGASAAQLPAHVNTGVNMSLLVLERPPLSPPLQAGGEITISVYAGDVPVSYTHLRAHET